ncbi:MAG: NAD(P)H-hydrate dehydratase [Thermoplasmata archaeon]|nr:NAD(P)H-hydrate dehydratase [Thermoplasmata archaeon]
MTADAVPRTPREMAVLEANASARGASVDDLMEQAGRVVAEEVIARLSDRSKPVAVVAGSGNNGGDGTAAAFYLSQWGQSVELWLLKPPKDLRTAAARRCFDRARRRVPTHVGLPDREALQRSGLVVDAMLGIGQAGSLRPPYDEASKRIQASGRPIVSIDVPSGLGSPGAVVPHWTVTLTCPKVGMTPATCGEILVRSIGIPPEALDWTGPGEFLLFPISPGRARSARVVVIGGGPFAGAPALTAMAALRAGAERATVLVPEPASQAVQQFAPELVVRPIGRERFRPADVPGILAQLERERFEVVVLGMGFGRDPETLTFANVLVQSLRHRGPLVVDADALEAAWNAPEDPGSFGIVATPNQGEYARLLGAPPPKDPVESIRVARESALARKLTLLVKGDPDLISDGSVVYRNGHHDPAISVSGVGDVLAGVTAALVAEGANGLEAARLAAYWVGEAGTRAASARSYGIIASDVLNELGPALADAIRAER